MVYTCAVLFLILNERCCITKKNHYTSEKTEENSPYDKYIKDSDLKISDLIVLLNQNIDSLSNIGSYKTEKKIIEDEEESGVRWKCIKYSNNDSLIFLIESDWISINKIARVTIFSNIIREDEVFVGQFVGEIKELLDENIPISPDGELLLVLKAHPEIHLQIDISNYPSLFYGVSNLLNVPDDVKIESIIIYNNESSLKKP